MPSFTDTFGGTVLYPAQPSYAAYTSSSSLSLSWPLETAPSNNVVAAINDINFTASGLTITLAAASMISTGIAPLFNNIGANQFTVLGASGSTILTATAGAQWIAYLADNTTTSGTWRTFQAGAGTSSASAAALAGYGLIAITTTLNQQYTTSSTAVTPTNLDATYRAAMTVWTGGAGTFTFTAAATLGNGWFTNIYNGGTGALTLDPNGGELIDGAATFQLNPGDSVIVICSGSAFWTVGFGQSSAFAFDFTTINVAGTGNYTLSGTELNRIAYRFTGVLTGNRHIIVPSTVQQYWVDNETTGAFTFDIGTSGQATPPQISQGARNIYYCDGTNVILADTSGFTTPLPITSGGTGASTASGARVNLDVPSNLDAFTYTQMFS